MSKFYQGDIRLDPELEDYVTTGGHSRNAIRERKLLWTSRVIPYRIPSWMSTYLYYFLSEWSRGWEKGGRGCILVWCVPSVMVLQLRCNKDNSTNQCPLSGVSVSKSK